MTGVRLARPFHSKFKRIRLTGFRQNRSKPNRNLEVSFRLAHQPCIRGHEYRAMFLIGGGPVGEKIIEKKERERFPKACLRRRRVRDGVAQVFDFCRHFCPMYVPSAAVPPRALQQPEPRHVNRLARTISFRAIEGLEINSNSLEHV